MKTAQQTLAHPYACNPHARNAALARLFPARRTSPHDSPRASRLATSLAPDLRTLPVLPSLSLLARQTQFSSPIIMIHTLPTCGPLVRDSAASRASPTGVHWATRAKLGGGSTGLSRVERRREGCRYGCTLSAMVHWTSCSSSRSPLSLLSLPLRSGVLDSPSVAAHQPIISVPAR